MAKSDSIGMFDSGVGGTSIFKEIHELMPLEKIIYLADSKNAPYGKKTKNEIIELAYKNTDLLIEMGCKIIVVACNTATTNAIDQLREKYNVPFIGIEPAIKKAALSSSKKSIGVLATKGTLTSKLFSKTSSTYTKDIQTIEVVGKGLVEAIESGKATAASTSVLLKKIMQPILEKDIDYLVLGCTHYPYLIPQLEKILPTRVKIIDSGKAVARQTRSVLKFGNQLAEVQQDIPEFYTNKNPRILKRFLGDINCKIRYLNF
ncbi:MAG TPA: glutamate racemase [Flavobacteriaceae bacterium]|nr:glutamate racemase [Flavobacteriaceae bacterium]